MRFNIRKGDVTQKEMYQIGIVSIAILVIYVILSKLFSSVSFFAMMGILVASTTIAFTAVSFFMGELKSKNSWKVGISAGVLRGIFLAIAYVVFMYALNVGTLSYLLIWLTTFFVLVVSEFTIDPMILKLK